MTKILEHGGVTVNDEGVKAPRLVSIGLGLYSGLVFFPTRFYEHLAPAVVAFLGASGFLTAAIFFAFLNSFGVISSGFAGNVRLSDSVNSQD